MELGFNAARDAVTALDDGADPTAIFNAAAKSFLNAVGASSGPLYATAFMRAGAAVKGKATLSDAEFVAAFQAMAQGIRDRGKAEPGEKTMVDAWAPAVGCCGRGAVGWKARQPTHRRRGNSRGRRRGGDQGHGRGERTLRAAGRPLHRPCRPWCRLCRDGDQGDGRQPERLGRARSAVRAIALAASRMIST